MKIVWLLLFFALAVFELNRLAQVPKRRYREEEQKESRQSGKAEERHKQVQRSQWKDLKEHYLERRKRQTLKENMTTSTKNLDPKKARAAENLAEWTQGLRIEKATGRMQFQRIGAVYPSSKWGHIIIKIKPQLLHKAILDRKEKATWFNMSMLEHIILRAEKRLDLDMRVFQTRDNRQQRDVFGVLGGMVGLFNLWQTRNIQRLEESTRRALRTTALQVDSLIGSLNQQRRTLLSLQKELREKKAYELKQELALDWLELESHLLAFSDLAQTLIHGKLNRGLFRLIDMDETWHKFVAHQLRLDRLVPFEFHYQLLGCPTTFWTKDNWINLVIHIPTIQKEHRPLGLFRPKWNPVLREGIAYHLQLPDSPLLARTSEGYWATDEKEIGECFKVAKTHYCMGKTIPLADSRGSCLSALWEGRWETVKARCPMTAQKALPGAWTTARNKVAIYSPNNTLLLTQCKDGKAAHRQIQGYVLVSLMEGCQAAMSGLRIIGPSNETDRVLETVEVKPEDWSKVMPVMDRDVEISIPQPVQSVFEKIQDQMAEGEDHTFPLVIIALVVAAAAFLTALVFLLYFYYRFNRAAAATFDMVELPEVQVQEAPNKAHE